MGMGTKRGTDAPMRKYGWRNGVVLLLSCLLLGLVGVAPAPPALAETGTKALLLGSSTFGGLGSVEAVEATAAGFTVTVASDAAWTAMTAADFADYQLVIVGEGVLPAPVGANRKNLSDAVMARAGGNTRAGNRILVGTDPRNHRSAGATGDGGRKVIETALRFAGAQEGATGLYLGIAYGDPDHDGTGVGDGIELLRQLTTAAATWTDNASPPCGGTASLIANAAQFSTLTSAHVQGWFCSVHRTYPTFPTDWSPLSLATDAATKPVCGTDTDTGAAVCGEAYILIAGSGITTTAPNLALTPPTATNPVGTTHTVTAKVTNTDGTPRPGVLVDFAVTGVNVGATGTCVPADCKSAANGEVTFTYTGVNPGVDTINAAITVDGARQTATAEKIWGGGGGTSADLSITKTDDVDPVPVGQSLTYTVTVTNSAAAPATGVVVTDTLPAGVTLVSAVPSQGTCGAPAVTCNLGSLAPLASATVVIKVTPNTAGTITNRASVTFTGTDPTPANNTASQSTKVQPSISINSVSVLEGDPPTLTPAVFTVSLSVPSSDTVTVDYAAAPGTATAVPLPGDYVATTGVLTFNPGETTKALTVQVKGDLVDEPDETFLVNLSGAVNTLIGTGQGIGTIRDDERNGKFSCRATGLRLLGLELGVANAPNSPCADDTTAITGRNLSVLGVGVNAGAIQVSTDQTPNDLEATSPAVGDKGLATAKVTSVRIAVGLTTITADVVTSTATVECGSPITSAPRLTGSSQVVNVRVNGNLVANGSAKVDINIPLVGVLHINHKTVTSGVLTQRAIWLEGSLSTAQVVIAEAKANFTGNPCDE